MHHHGFAVFVSGPSHSYLIVQMCFPVVNVHNNSICNVERAIYSSYRVHVWFATMITLVACQFSASGKSHTKFGYYTRTANRASVLLRFGRVSAQPSCCRKFPIFFSDASADEVECSSWGCYTREDAPCVLNARGSGNVAAYASFYAPSDTPPRAAMHICLVHIQITGYSRPGNLTHRDTRRGPPQSSPRPAGDGAVNNEAGGATTRHRSTAVAAPLFTTSRHQPSPSVHLVHIA